MIKKFLLAIAIAIPAIASAQGKFGVVNADAILPSMPEYTTAQEQYTAASKTYEDEYAKLTEELEKKYKEFQALPEDTPAAMRESRGRELQELDNRMQAFMQNAQQDLARQQQNLMAPIQEKLVNAIKAVGAEGGYTMIFPEGVSIYTGTDVTDVTDAVKAKLGVK